MHKDHHQELTRLCNITQINDPTTFKTLLSKEATAVTANGGRFVTRTNYITALDGVAPLRYIIIAFDSVQKAQSGTTPQRRLRPTPCA